MDLKIAISPCPNDTFIFGPIILGKIDTGIYKFDFTYADIDELNKMSFTGGFDLIKMSYYHYLSADPDYNALPCGGAMGYNCGPLFVTSDLQEYLQNDEPLVGIPGINTTAHFLLNFYKPDIQDKKVIRFDHIEDSIQEKIVDAGVIIHEGRFTYQQKGLQLIQDLGEYWHQKTKMPIPLGCIGMHIRYSWHDQEQLTNIIRKSIQYAEAHTDELMPFIKMHAQEMQENVIREHIKLYVNHFTYHIEREGRLAIEKMGMEISRQALV